MPTIAHTPVTKMKEQQRTRGSTLFGNTQIFLPTFIWPFGCPIASVSLRERSNRRFGCAGEISSGPRAPGR